MVQSPLASCALTKEAVDGVSLLPMPFVLIDDDHSRCITHSFVFL